MRRLVSPLSPLVVSIVLACLSLSGPLERAAGQTCVPRAEACGGGDEDCDGQVDEEGAAGCRLYRRDADFDTVGVATDSKCLCVPTGLYTAMNDGVADCNDANAAVNPARQETCATLFDDDCDGQVNEDDASGCVSYFRDDDRDGYGVLPGRCACARSAPYDSTSPLDCDDQRASRAPGRTETCNGIDDNCAGGVDEATSSTLCPATTAHVVVSACMGAQWGACMVTTCAAGYHDVDRSYANGCEVRQDAVDRAGAGDSCAAAYSVGTLSDTQPPVTATGNCVPAADVDWFSVQATDGPDADATVDFSVRLSVNPGLAYRLDLYRGSCAVVEASGVVAAASSVPGYYYIRVYRSDGRATPANEDYELTIRSSAPLLPPPLRGPVTAPHL